MDKLRRTLLAAIALSPFAARAQSSRNGAAYTTLQNHLPIETPGKIEVAEFFWYGCIHCYNLEPLLEKWLPSLAAGTRFRRLPTVFNERWGHDAVIYYAFEALGVLDKLHRPFFDAIHRDRLKTDNPQALAEWLTKKGN